MKSEEMTEAILEPQAEEIVEEPIVLSIPQEIETVEQERKDETPTSQENIAQLVYENKRKIHTVIKRPNYFKCRAYIMESIKYSVDRVLMGYSKGIKFQNGETYTQYVKRVRG